MGEERRVLYGVFSLITTKGTATATNSIFVDGLPNGEDRLTLKEIRQVERSMVAECRMTNPEITSAMLVRWAWLRSDEARTRPSPKLRRLPAMASDKSLAAEIEAVLRRHIKCDATGLAPAVASVFLQGIPEAAAEITALQSRAFEDGARWMRERAYGAVIDVRHAAACNFSPEFSGAQGEARTNSLATAAKAVLALPLQPEGERNV